MADNNNFLQTCLMNLDQVALVLDMLEGNEEFAEVGIDIRLDLENIEPHNGNRGCGEEVMVIFDIPRSMSMPVFYGKFHLALNRETVSFKSKEKE